MIKKKIRVLLSAIIAFTVICIVAVLTLNKKLDKVFLLEVSNPGLFYVLQKAESVDASTLLKNNSGEKMSDAEIDTIKAHRLVYANKDGFAEVKPRDIRAYINNIICEYPSVGFVSIMFSDKTGIEIPVDNLKNAVYGSINDFGIIHKEVCKVNLNKRLISQVEGVTDLNRKYDSNRNVIYQFRTDENGNAVPKVSGIAGFEREYDESGNVTMQIYLGEDGKPLEMPGGYYGISQKWDDGTLIERVYLNENHEPTMRTDGYSKAVWKLGENGKTWNLRLEDLSGNSVSLEGKNLARDLNLGKDEWSEWIEPKLGIENYSINIGCANLGEKFPGDIYTSQVEIEFKGVRSTEGKEFAFWTQGAQDGEWFGENVWDLSLISLHEVPEDGVYKYVVSVVINEHMADISNFDIGFRCDNWSTGAFRVRNIKIEKGDSASECSPGI